MMKFTCAKNDLMDGINIVNKAVSGRTTLPILECILLTAKPSGLVLTGNDLEMGIETAPIDANIVQPGCVALEAKLFSDIIRRSNGETVSLECDEKNAVTIRCGTSEFNIMGQNGDEFPSLTDVERTEPYTMKQSDLKNMIRQTIFSIAQDGSKPVLTGELLELKGDCLQIVSVDGYRISFRKCPLTSAGQNAEVIVPGKTMTELNKILSQEEEEMVTLYFTDKHILFDMGNATLVSRLVEGDYIRYAQSFSNEWKTEIIVEKSELIQALERVSLVSRENRKTPVKLEIKKGVLVLTARSEMGNAYEEVSIGFEGEELQIAFNPRYLIEALRAIDEDQVKIRFTATLSPCTMHPLDGDSFRYLILPLRM